MNITTEDVKNQREVWFVLNGNTPIKSKLLRTENNFYVVTHKNRGGVFIYLYKHEIYPDINTLLRRRNIVGEFQFNSTTYVSKISRVVFNCKDFINNKKYKGSPRRDPFYLVKFSDMFQDNTEGFICIPISKMNFISETSCNSI